MPSFIDMTGTKVGMILVVSYAGPLTNGHSWNCVCDCGKEFVTNGASIREGAKCRTTKNGWMTGTRSCGCIKKREEWRKVPAKIKSMRKAFNMIRQNAKIRDLPFELDETTMEQMLAQNCHYCNAPPTNKGWAEFDGAYMYNGIDRVDSSKGYLIDNVVTCCPHCNMAKRDRPYDDFVKWIESAYNHLFLKGNS